MLRSIVVSDVANASEGAHRRWQRSSEYVWRSLLTRAVLALSFLTARSISQNAAGLPTLD